MGEETNRERVRAYVPGNFGLPQSPYQGNCKKMLSIRLFGAFEARLEDRTMPRLQAREGERLLAYFTLSHDTPILYRTIAEVFWPADIRMTYGLQGDFPSARQAVYSLRQALGSEASRLVSQGKGVLSFTLHEAEVDVVAFDRLAAASHIGAWQGAVALYQGPLLETWTETWAVEARNRRKRTYERLLRRLLSHAQETGDAESCEVWLRRGQASSPEEESWTCELITLLSVQRRYLDVKETFEDIRARLEEQGRKPGADTEALFAKIQREAQQIRMPESRSARLESRPLPPPTSFGSSLPPAKAAPTPAASRPVTTDGAETGSLLEESLLEPSGGAVALDSRFYITRPADGRFLAALARPDSIVLVKGARQMGKTSLLARGLQQARASGARVALSDFQSLNEEQIETPDHLFLTLATGIALQLELDVSVRKLWDPDFGPSLNLEIFLRQHVLRPENGPFVWGMDEVDRLFLCPFRNEVFGLFRSWHNRRSLEPAGPWGRLTLAMAYATEAHLFITDINQSPFNVGTRVALNDFTFEQVEELNERYNAPLRNSTDLTRFYALLCGHPYLTRCALDELARHAYDLDRLEADGGSDNGPFGEHLRRLRLLIGSNSEMSEAIRDLLNGQPCASPDLFYRLRSAGIVSGEWGRDIRLRCPVYATFFTRGLL